MSVLLATPAAAVSTATATTSITTSGRAGGT